MCKISGVRRSCSKPLLRLHSSSPTKIVCVLLLICVVLLPLFCFPQTIPPVANNNGAQNTKIGGNAPQNQKQVWNVNDNDVHIKQRDSGLIVVTMDGSVYSVDYETGDLKWSVDTGDPILTSSHYDMVSDPTTQRSRTDSRFVMPSINGSLYMYLPGEGLHKLPMTVKELADQAPFQTNDGTLYLSSKQTTVYSIDESTGDLLCKYDSLQRAKQHVNTNNGDYCFTPDRKHDDSTAAAPSERPTSLLSAPDTDQHSNYTNAHEGKGKLLYVIRTDYFVKEIDSMGHMQWNFSFSEFKPAHQHNTKEGIVISEDPEQGDLSYQESPKAFSTADGSFYFKHNEKQERPANILHFPSPVVDVFYNHHRGPNSQSFERIFFPTFLNSVPTNIDSSHAGSLVYVGESKGQLFVVDGVTLPGSNVPALPSSEQSNEPTETLVGVHVVGADKHLSLNQDKIVPLEPPQSTKTVTGADTPTPTESNNLGLLHAVSYYLGIISPDGEQQRGNGLMMVFSFGMITGTVLLSTIIAIVFLLYNRGAAKRPPDSAQAAALAPSPTKPKPKTGKKAHHSKTNKKASKARKGLQYQREDEEGSEEQEQEQETTASAAITATQTLKEQPAPQENTDSVVTPYASGSTNAPQAVPSVTPSPSRFFRTAVEDAPNVARVGKLTFFTDKILGHGSHGTIVFEGVMDDGRKVAVKRMLSEFISSARTEIDLLIETDRHPNVVRYYAQEEDGQFIYLALELCPYTLADLVGDHQNNNSSSSGSGDTSGTNRTTRTPKANMQPPPVLSESEKIEMLRQLTHAVNHIHSLNIVHRDLKPHNILISADHKVKVSDLGLGKMLDINKTSYDTDIGGSLGWQPAEVLVQMNNNMSNNNINNDQNGARRRMTRAVDIFSLGCIMYYFITGGSHPFGDRYERESNILKGKHNLDALKHNPEAQDLIASMIAYDPAKRIAGKDILRHPFFWSLETRLFFLGDVSDQLGKEKLQSVVYHEIEARKREIFDLPPPPPPLQPMKKNQNVYGGGANNKKPPCAWNMQLLEQPPVRWDIKLHECVKRNVEKYRKYDYELATDLLRCIRNIRNHYREYDEDVQKLFFGSGGAGASTTTTTTTTATAGGDSITTTIDNNSHSHSGSGGVGSSSSSAANAASSGGGGQQDGIYLYFTHPDRFPRMLMIIYYIVAQHWKTRDVFRRYF